MRVDLKRIVLAVLTLGVLVSTCAFAVFGRDSDGGMTVIPAETPTPARQSMDTEPSTSSQAVVSGKPDNFAGTEEEWRQLSERWRNEINAGGWPTEWPFLVPFEEASKQAEKEGWGDFCIHGLPKPSDQQECRGENGEGNEIHFERSWSGDGWSLKAIFRQPR